MRYLVTCALLLCLTQAGCAGLLASPTADVNPACELAPLADEISKQAEAALAAARIGDRDAMQRAANAVGDMVDRIFTMYEATEPQPSLDPLLGSLLSLVYVGNQVSALFGDAVPSPEVLTSYEDTIAGALGLHVADVKSQAAVCP
jgi:hypothetical protein